MTVAELITELTRQKPEIQVYIEGCDCMGRAGGVERETVWDTGENYVLITREEE